MVYILVSGVAFLLCLALVLMGLDAPLETPVFIGVWVFGAALPVSVLRYLVSGR